MRLLKGRAVARCAILAISRIVPVVHDVAWLQERHQWSGLKAVVVIDSLREIGPKTERETRFYLTSSQLRADNLDSIVRDHWAIENGLYWVMDMTFRDDECGIRTENAPRTSSPSSTWPSISPDGKKARIPFASGREESAQNH
ncbi:MAG: ISAs1 family transposase [Methylovirgula sp.]